MYINIITAMSRIDLGLVDQPTTHRGDPSKNTRSLLTPASSSKTHSWTVRFRHGWDMSLINVFIAIGTLVVCRGHD
jgi:hypothetical protein